MQIVDFNTNKVGLGYDSTSDTIGIVIKTSKELDERPLLGLIIPKFMMGYSFKNGDKATDTTIPINTSKFINSEKCFGFLSNDVNIKNYILVRPYLNQNQSMPDYVIGDKVIVTMIDQDIKTIAFLPYSINRLGQRATDKLMFSVPGNPKQNIALTEDNTYFFKMDSSEKVVIIGTSKENGEVSRYTIGIDAENGQVLITDNEDLSWVLDTKNDSVITKTSGTEINQTSDKIELKADTINLTADSKVKIKTDTFEVESNTIKESASDTKYEFDNFKQKSDIGKFEIQNESHEGMAMSVEESTYHNDTPLIGLNGQVVFPNFVIGAVPNINVPVPPTSGSSGPKGAMIMQTDPSGVPLAKYPQLVAALTAIAAAADSPVGGMGAATAAASTFAASGMTTKLLSS
jgi:hypothetical protein